MDSTKRSRNEPAPVSVVIPAYNAGAVIRRAIDSVLRQTRPPAEIIVIDDGSTDDTRAVLKRYDGLVKYRYQDNAGVSAARNHGIRAAAQDWIAFLDADDIWLPDKLERQHAILQRDARLKWCAGRVSRIEGGRCAPEPALPRLLWENLIASQSIPVFQGLANRLRMHVSAVMCHRTLLEEVGAFDEHLSISEDRDLWWRIGLQHPVIGYCIAPCCHYHADTPNSLIKRSRDRSESLNVVCNNLLRARSSAALGATFLVEYVRFLGVKLLMRHACGEITLREEIRSRAAQLLALTPVEHLQINTLKMLPPPLARKLHNGVARLVTS